MNEVSSCEAFRLGWEHAILDPSTCHFFGPQAFDPANRVESNNYDLDHYVTKKGLGVDFAEELDEETETRGEGSQVSKSGHLDPSATNQAESKSPAVLSTNSSKLEGCLNVPSGAISTGSFDDNVVIDFATPLLESLVIPILEFMDQARTP